MKTIHYYLAPRSPWTYMGHKRLLSIAKRHGAQVEPRPFGLGEVIFPMSGGLQLKDRPPQRQSYRLVELARWSKFLEMPLILQPKHFPMDETPAALLIAAAILRYGNDAGLDLTWACLQAVWARELDISNSGVLVQLANECNLEGQELLNASTNQETRDLYDRNTQEAVKTQVFGAPWYEYNGESFWGQDRLDFLDRALSE